MKTRSDTSVFLSGVEKAYTSPSGRLPVLRGLDLVVEKGSSVAIVGPSGSGKSTLLNIMGALDNADSGDVQINGRDISGLDADARANFRNREVGFVFQMHHLLPQCTVMENILVPSLVVRNRERRAGAGERAAALLSRIGLAERSDYFPGQLSGGERLRTAVVRSLINSPSIVLADEPTGSLDNETADTLADVLLELNADDGTTLVAVTHSGRFAASFGTTYRLENGVLIRCD